MFMPYFTSKINHLLENIALSNNLISLRTVLKIITVWQVGTVLAQYYSGYVLEKDNYL